MKEVATVSSTISCAVGGFSSGSVETEDLEEDSNADHPGAVRQGEEEEREIVSFGVYFV